MNCDPGVDASAPAPSFRWEREAKGAGGRRRPAPGSLLPLPTTDGECTRVDILNRCPECGAEPVYFTVKHVWRTRIDHQAVCSRRDEHAFSVSDFPAGGGR